MDPATRIAHQANQRYQAEITALLQRHGFTEIARPLDALWVQRPHNLATPRDPTTGGPRYYALYEDLCGARARVARPGGGWSYWEWQDALGAPDEGRPATREEERELEREPGTWE